MPLLQPWGLCPHTCPPSASDAVCGAVVMNKWDRWGTGEAEHSWVHHLPALLQLGPRLMVTEGPQHPSLEDRSWNKLPNSKNWKQRGAELQWGATSGKLWAGNRKETEPSVMLGGKGDPDIPVSSESLQNWEGERATISKKWSLLSSGDITGQPGDTTP